MWFVRIVRLYDGRKVNVRVYGFETAASAAVYATEMAAAGAVCTIEKEDCHECQPL